MRPRLKSLTEQTNGGLGTSVTRLVGGGLASLRSGRINTSGSGGAGAPSAAEDDGGCNASDAPFVPWVVLMSLVTLVLMRRRQTA